MTTTSERKTFEIESSKSVQALFNAVSSSKLRLIRLLIEGGIHVNIRNSQSQTPLLAACSSLEKNHFRGETREKVVKYLIAAGANVNDQDQTGRTPLIYAIITQAHTSVIFNLVEAGADLWLEDDSHNCAFDYAVQQGDLSQVGILVEANKRCKKHPHKETDSPRKILTGIFGHGKRSRTRRLENRYRIRKEFPRNRGYQKLVNYQSTMSPSTRNTPPEGTGDSVKIPQDIKTLPKRPIMSPQVSEEKQLCNLCKNVIIGDSLPNTAEGSDADIKSGKSTDFLDLNCSAYDLSGLLYRRRSTGSLFGLTEQRCESIRRKKDLGITLEDLFSNTEINQPFSEGQSIFVKSPRTNTMVNIAAKGLAVQDLNRTRSISVSLPPTDNARQGLRFLGEQAFSRTPGEKPLLLGHELLSRSSEATASLLAPSPLCFNEKGSVLYASDSRIYLANDSDGDDDWDDFLVIPTSQNDLTPPRVDATSSQRDLTSPQEERPLSPGGTTSRSGESNSCSSPIPRIVLTHFVISSHEA